MKWNVAFRKIMSDLPHPAADREQYFFGIDTVKHTYPPTQTIPSCMGQIHFQMRSIFPPPPLLCTPPEGGDDGKRGGGGNLGEPSNPTRLFVRCLVGRKDKFPNQVTSQSLLFPPFLHLSALSLFPHPPPPPPPSKGLSSNMCVQIVCETRYPLRHTHWGEAAIASLSPLFLPKKRSFFALCFSFLNMCQILCDRTV